MKTNKEIEAERYPFIFPKFLVRKMASVNQIKLLQVNMNSLSLVLLAVSLMAIYMVYVMDGWIYKGIIIFNVGCAWVMLSSQIVTTINQIKNLKAQELKGVLY